MEVILRNLQCLLVNPAISGEPELPTSNHYLSQPDRKLEQAVQAQIKSRSWRAGVCARETGDIEDSLEISSLFEFIIRE